MTAATNVSAPQHPRALSMQSWRARLGAFASRGETSGPRVDECNIALDWWRDRTYFIEHKGVDADEAESLADMLNHAAVAR